VNQIESSDFTTTSFGELQPLALVAVGDHRDAPSMLGARDAPPAMLARHEPALPVDGVAVRIAAGRAETR
jgi:hypothetical protein